MKNLLKSLDYSVLQQCMHCGMCLPVCPTYAETKEERHGPRGRISLMRAIADGELEITRGFADEMYYCLGCLACTSACPAGVNYAELFETARAEVERRHVIKSTQRDFWRWSVVKVLFTRPRLLRLAGRGLWLWRVTGMQALTRALRLTYLLPRRLRELEPQAPRVGAKFSHQLIKPVEKPAQQKRRVAVLTGCVQDLAFPEINRATVDVLLANNCEVHTPPVQPCCGSLHAHNGDLESARTLARRLIDMIPPENFDAIISNAGGCGSHLRHYDHLLRDDPAYAARAVEWSEKLRDISEYLVEIDFRKPAARAVTQTVTYHESCHLCHGQKVSAQPRAVLRAIPGVELRECPEAAWCCGSAGIYNITQPVTAGRLQDRKMANLRRAHAGIITTANPGCHLQIQNGLRAEKDTVTEVAHPVVLLARAYAAEKNEAAARA
ncbi:glycolate oxidase iron-sulfur subunit [Ereboglobus sp. PH5-10]|uniref:(Fe-S)-binding protein n=1 Tax=Ereboglobus sp. PH5-10 TaxID=2940629 RepID=UPI002406C7B5|nr:heterodisulfide reductase-related iron-sulfur binding cluster [Ereboglobus sp. PH5-10]MDF9827336.1 glycolate oxidase iron-sulfur subunit [Ereboglobus sp. PH5-10]